MPFNKADAVVCVNHPSTQMVRNTGFNALVKFEKGSDGSLAFNTSSGIPLVVYYCPICGYIESYVAQKTPAWNEK
jgi:hypothetical protein